MTKQIDLVVGNWNCAQPQLLVFLFLKEPVMLSSFAMPCIVLAEFSSLRWHNI